MKEKNARRYGRLSLLRKSETVVPAGPSDARLETFDNIYASRDYEVVFDCPEFTSLCPVTGQPDFGSIEIRYVPGDSCIESKSLKLYLYSFRNHNMFHEEAVNRILDDLVSACGPKSAEVRGEFRPRGGISIKVSAYYDGKQKSIRGRAGES